MEISRDKMITVLERVQKDVRVREVFFAGFSPRPDKQLQILPVPRLIMPLSGRKWIETAIDSKRHKLVMRPGQVLFCPSFSWTRPRWHLDGEIISAVFHNDYLRVLYVDQKNNRRLLAPDIYYHTSKPISQAASHLIHTLELMVNTPRLRTAGEYTAEALLELILVDVRNAPASAESKSRQTWKALVDYLGEHATENIGRAELAEHFQLHPSYISKLFRNYAGTSFQDYLCDIRMRFAAKLLSEPGATVSQTARQCGYRYTSYFIRAFRKHYDTSPGRYHKRQ